MCARYSAIAPSVSRSRTPVSGSRVVTEQRPTFSRTRTSASPTRTREPIQPSSTCGSARVDADRHAEPPPVDRLLRSRRRSQRLERPGGDQRRACDASTVVAVALALGARDPHGLSRELGQRLAPRPLDDAAAHRPAVEARLDAARRASSVAPSTAVPSGKRSARRPFSTVGLHGEQRRDALRVDERARRRRRGRSAGRRGRRSSPARPRRR